MFLFARKGMFFYILTVDCNRTKAIENSDCFWLGKRKFKDVGALANIFVDF